MLAVPFTALAEPTDLAVGNPSLRRNLSAEVWKVHGQCYHMRVVAWGCRFSKVLALLYLTLGLVIVGGLGIFAVTGESLYDACWQVRFQSSAVASPAVCCCRVACLSKYQVAFLFDPLPYWSLPVVTISGVS
jgi:hypothetical protein